jgi:multiple sugar transport system ATP-binding protein
MGNPQANLVDGLIKKENGGLCFEAKEGDFRIPLGNKTEGLESNKDLVVAIRPEDIQIEEANTPDSMEMTIYSVLPAGSETIIYVRRGTSIELVIKKPEEETRDLTMDQRIHVSFKALNFYDAKTEKLIASKE